MPKKYSMNKGPAAEDIALVPKPLLELVPKLAHLLRGVAANWAIGGDLAEVIGGVNVKAEYISLITTKEGCDKISTALIAFQTLAPGSRESALERPADVDGKLYPVRIRSHYAEFTIDGTRVKVYGDLQVKVGEWDWGDPLEFQPTYTYVVGKKVPMFPLRLISELYLGLGWTDRLELITDALARAH